MFIHLLLVISNSALYYCLATYELFPGFDATNSTKDSLKFNVNNTTVSLNKQTNLTNNVTEEIPTEPTTIRNASEIAHLRAEVDNCEEEEQPFNIGPYEVPTQKDLVLLTKRILLNSYKRYHKKALYFLHDIKGATRATSDITKKCQGNRTAYKKCVKKVSQQCEYITKGLVTSLEKQKEEVLALTKGKICNMASMKEGTLELIKVLAMEEASLEFALPGFLRLLNKCFTYCSLSNMQFQKKPSRHMSDQQLVAKHLLNSKNY